MTGITVTDPDRPLRKDAERNRQRILEAARDLFARRGLGVSLNDIAHHAGVGVGTVYRRFPDKSKLIDDLFEQRLSDMLALAEEAQADPDPWRALTTFIDRVLELQADDRGIKDLICEMPNGLERVAEVRAQMIPRAAQLIRRAQESGDLRADIAPQDLPVMLLIMSTIIDASRDVEPDVWRRYAAIMLRGISAKPELQPPLPVEPLSPEQVDVVMTHRTRSLQAPDLTTDKLSAVAEVQSPAVPRALRSAS